MTVLINNYGGPGTGKSSISGGVFSLLKLHGINCEFATEYAKELVWWKNLGMLNFQWKVFGEQAYRIARLNNEVDFIICDSPLLQSINYVGEEYINEYSKIIKIVESMFDDVIHNFLIRKKKYETKGREQTEAEAKVININTINILKKHVNHYNIYDGNYTAINDITKYVLDSINIKHEYKILKI